MGPFMKKCSKCEIEKNETEFWVRKNRKSGVNSECKTCASLRRRSLDKEKINKQQREWRKKNPGYATKINSEYQKKNKEKVNEYHREWYQKNKDKFREQRSHQRERINSWARGYTKKEEVRFKLNANGLLNYHVKRGNIVKPQSCQICSEVRKLESHHHDYKKPLDIIWICIPCHKAIHKRLKEEQKYGNQRTTQTIKKYNATRAICRPC